MLAAAARRAGPLWRGALAAWLLLSLQPQAPTTQQIILPLPLHFFLSPSSWSPALDDLGCGPRSISSTCCHCAIMQGDGRAAPRAAPRGSAVHQGVQQQQLAAAATAANVRAFFYANGIAFYASRSLEFREMVAAIARQGAAYTAPKYDALRTTLLDTTRQVNNNI